MSEGRPAFMRALSAGKLAAFQEHVPELAWNGMFWEGPCPHCHQRTLQLKPLSPTAFEPWCIQGCTAAQIRDAMRAEFLGKRGQLNGGGPELREPEAAALVVEPLHYSDLGNARRLVRRHGENLRFTGAHGWLVWDGRRWLRDRTGEAKRLAKETVLTLYPEAADLPETERKALLRWALTSEEAKRLRDMLGVAESESEVAALPEAFDRHPELLTLANGTLDLTSGQLRAHNRNDLLTRLVEIDWDPSARCPRFLAFLSSVFAAQAEVIAFIRRAIGYSLTGETREQTLFFLHGSGSNGKSTLLALLLALLGEMGSQAAPGLILERRADRHPTEIADLAGKRAVVCVEIGEGKRMAEEMVKQMTGGDRLKGRFMHRDFFEFQPEFKLWLAANHKPLIRGTDDAIWRRIPLIPFQVRFTDAEPEGSPNRKDPQLLPKLQAELPGILAWAVAGCLEWQRVGLKIPAAVQEASAAYRSDMDLIGQFIEDRCVVNPALFAYTTPLYESFSAWCEKAGEQPISQHLFADRLKERGFTRDQETRGQRKRLWRGLGLRDLEQL